MRSADPPKSRHQQRKGGVREHRAEPDGVCKRLGDSPRKLQRRGGRQEDGTERHQSQRIAGPQIAPRRRRNPSTLAPQRRAGAKGEDGAEIQRTLAGESAHEGFLTMWCFIADNGGRRKQLFTIIAVWKLNFG